MRKVIVGTTKAEAEAEVKDKTQKVQTNREEKKTNGAEKKCQRI